MNVWNPSHVQFTVLRARNLISKGKGGEEQPLRYKRGNSTTSCKPDQLTRRRAPTDGNLKAMSDDPNSAPSIASKAGSGSNDVFVTIQLGKEKYQTSTIKNAQNPEWFEECDLPIPHMHSEIEVQLFHRGILSDDFLGYTSIPLWEQKIQDKAKSQWIQLKNKPARGPDNKPRGEIEVKVTFHSHSRVDFSSGLKKRSSSLRNIATAFGDRLKLTRSKSFRENRKDPEGGKPDKHQNQNHAPSSDVPERKQHIQKGIVTPAERKPTATPFPAVSFPALDVDHSWVDAAEEGLTRSYSMSAAYVKTMSVDRGRILSLASSADQPEDISQSAYNIAGDRRSMVELPSSQAPPPYHIRPSSQDDTILVQRDRNQRAQIRRPLFASAQYVDSGHRRERTRCESIRERTEPEESSSTDEERPIRRPRPPPRHRWSRPSLQETVPEVAEEASFAHLNSNPQGNTPICLGSDERVLAESPRPETITNGSLQYDRSSLTGSIGRRVKLGNSLGYPNGEVTMRKRSKRDRVQILRQAGRCFTVQGFEGRLSGLYDDSLSDPSDSSKTEISDDTIAIFKTMNKEELLHVVIQNKAQLIRKDQYIKDLENYVDDLLVRVMECTPRILHRPPMHHR